MANTSSLSIQRDKYFSLRDRGVITDSETSNAFIDLLMNAPNDESALNLFEGLPEWFCGVFRNSLNELSTMKFYRRRFGIGDSRTEEQVHEDAVRQQNL